MAEMFNNLQIGNNKFNKPNPAPNESAGHGGQKDKDKEVAAKFDPDKTKSGLTANDPDWKTAKRREILAKLAELRNNKND